MRLKSRKTELKQRVKVSYAINIGMFPHDRGYNIRFIFTNTKSHLFRIPN